MPLVVFMEGFLSVEPDPLSQLTKDLGNIWYSCISALYLICFRWQLSILRIWIYLLWPSINMLWMMSWVNGGSRYINSVFFEIDSKLECLCIFQEKGDYSLCLLVVVCHKGNIISKHEFAYQNISGLFCRIKLTEVLLINYMCLKTPSHGEDETQGQFSKRSLTSLISVSSFS